MLFFQLSYLKTVANHNKDLPRYNQTIPTAHSPGHGHVVMAMAMVMATAMVVVIDLEIQGIRLGYGHSITPPLDAN